MYDLRAERGHLSRQGRLCRRATGKGEDIVCNGPRVSGPACPLGPHSRDRAHPTPAQANVTPRKIAASTKSVGVATRTMHPPTMPPPAREPLGRGGAGYWYPPATCRRTRGRRQRYSLMLHENPTFPTPQKENRIDKGISGFYPMSGFSSWTRHQPPDPTPRPNECRVTNRMSGSPFPNPTSNIGLVMRETRTNVGFVGFRKREGRSRLTGRRAPLVVAVRYSPILAPKATRDQKGGGKTLLDPRPCRLLLGRISAIALPARASAIPKRSSPYAPERRPGIR